MVLIVVLIVALPGICQSLILVEFDNLNVSL